MTDLAPPAPSDELIAWAQDVARQAGLVLADWQKRLLGTRPLTRRDVVLFGGHDPAPRPGRRCGWYPGRPRRRPTCARATRWEHRS